MDLPIRKIEVPQEPLAWWGEMQQNSGLFAAWLDGQAYEASCASEYFWGLGTHFDASHDKCIILRTVAEQKAQHNRLLRRLAPALYFPRRSHAPASALVSAYSLEEVMAAAYLALKVRAGRMLAICLDPEAPKNVADALGQIMPDEEYHARAFRAFTTPEALDKMRGAYIDLAPKLGLSW